MLNLIQLDTEENHCFGKKSENMLQNLSDNKIIPKHLPRYTDLQDLQFVEVIVDYF